MTSTVDREIAKLVDRKFRRVNRKQLQALRRDGWKFQGAKVSWEMDYSANCLKPLVVSVLRKREKVAA